MACGSCSQPLPEAARFCPFCGHQVVATAGEERRLITVLFADIVGYTGLVEYLDPERAKRLIDDAFERLIADVVEYGGSVDKVLGDGVLALFGAPVAHEDDPDRAIRTALQMHDSLATFVAEHGELERNVQLRVGVNTGEVLFGRIGGTDDYTVLGDVVNVASRLQTLAPPGETYVGDSTAALTSSAIVLDPVDDLDVRGREQRETVWRARNVTRRTSQIRVQRDTPFVGRSEQRRLLASVFAMVKAGRSAIVAVSGEAGSGKSRLVAEAIIGADDDIAVLTGACAPYSETNMWAPIAAAMFGRIDPITFTSPDRVRERSIEQAVSHYGFDGEDPLLSWLVEGVLHLAGHDSAFDDLPPAQARENLFRLIVEALRRRTGQGPIVMWIDDLQWADNLLIDLLHRISRSLVDRPFLLITAQRHDAEIEWPPQGDQPVTLRMPLEPLGRPEAEELIASVAATPPDPLLTSRLYDRSGGNPLFLIELARLAGDPFDRVDLPSSLRVLIAARLDRLSPAQRAIIDNAAVLGTDGAIEDLETFAGEMNQPFLPEDLQALDQAGLLHIASGRGWRFRSDVVREVAYQTLTKLSRAQRHAGVALVMSEGGGVPIARIAHHAARAAELNAEIGPLTSIPADMCDRAVLLLTEAAQFALDVGAFRQTQRNATRALNLAPSDTAVIRRLRLLRATAATEMREFEGAGDDARTALQAAIEVDDCHDQGVAHRLIGVQAHGLGELATARQELDRSIEIFRDLGDDAELAISLADRGFCEIFGGSLSMADVLLDESEALATKLGDRRAGAWAHQHKALAAFLSGDTEVAAARIETAVAQFEVLGDRSGLSWAEAVRAYLAFYERRLDDAEAIAKTARAEALKLGERWGPAMMDSLVASIRLWTGNFEEAEALSRRSLVTFREMGDRFGTIQALAPHIRSLVALGRADEARSGLEEALTLSESSGNMAFPAMAAAGTAVHMGLGDRSVVIGELALERILAMGSNGGEVRTALALALCQAQRPDEALGHLLGVEDGFPYTHAVRALAHAMINDPTEALVQADRAISDDSATYLDLVIAAIAGAAAELCVGNVDAATTRLGGARQLATSTGDAVAEALTQAASSSMLNPGEPIDVSGLGIGWQQVLAGLRDVIGSPDPVTR